MTKNSTSAQFHHRHSSSRTRVMPSQTLSHHHPQVQPSRTPHATAINLPNPLSFLSRFNPQYLHKEIRFTYFLFVLMWPTRPQFAHFRCVACVWRPPETGAGVAGSPPSPLASGEPAPAAGEPASLAAAAFFDFRGRRFLTVWEDSMRAICSSILVDC